MKTKFFSVRDTITKNEKTTTNESKEQTKRKYLQYAYLMKDFFPDFIQNSYLNNKKQTKKIKK